MTCGSHENIHGTSGSQSNHGFCFLFGLHRRIESEQAELGLWTLDILCHYSSPTEITNGELLILAVRVA